MNGKQARKLRKIVGYHPGQPRDYDSEFKTAKMIRQLKLVKDAEGNDRVVSDVRPVSKHSVILTCKRREYKLLKKLFYINKSL